MAIVNAGTAAVTLSQTALTGEGFSTTGIGQGLMLNPGQSARLTVAFFPTVAGTAVGSVSLSTNASAQATVVTLTGQGIGVSHAVTLNWIADAADSVGFNIYRSGPSGDGWYRLNSSLQQIASYVDSTVQSGQLYLYAVSAVDSTGLESARSAAIQVLVPSP